MQSTGQGATHRSQPVHSAASTVCMRFAAPTIASTGHASMHSVQPMHRASSIARDGRAARARRARVSSGTAGRAGERRERGDHRVAAGRAAIDRVAGGDRVRVRAAAVVAAAPALHLRQRGVEAVGERTAAIGRHAPFYVGGLGRDAAFASMAAPHRCVRRDPASVRLPLPSPRPPAERPLGQGFLARLAFARSLARLARRDDEPLPRVA